MEAKVSEHADIPADVWSQRRGYQPKYSFLLLQQRTPPMPYDLNLPRTGLPRQTVTSAARLTGMPEKTTRRRIKDGTLPAYRIGRSIRISDDDLLRLYERVDMTPTDAQNCIQPLADAGKSRT